MTSDHVDNERWLLEIGWKAEQYDTLRKALEEIVALYRDSNAADFSPAMYRVAEKALRETSDSKEQKNG